MPEINEDDTVMFSGLIGLDLIKSITVLKEFGVPDIPGISNILNIISSHRPLGVYKERLISNIEKALSEIEFIYSLNRLNVSITRGKKKTIVILTDVLLDKPIELLDVDDANIEKGISFVCDFEKFMKKTEDDTETDYERFSDGNLQIEVMRKRCKKKR